MKWLVTAGNTVTFVDQVRCITNVFSGRTGADDRRGGCVSRSFRGPPDLTPGSPRTARAPGRLRPDSESTSGVSGPLTTSNVS